MRLASVLLFGGMLGGVLSACGMGIDDNASKGSQSITFEPVAQQTVGKAYTLQASSSKGLPITYSAKPAAVCSVSGATLTLASAGTCTVNASQSGSTQYSAAKDASQDIQVIAASDTPTPPTGKTVYESKCAGCHSSPPDPRAMKAAGKPEVITAAINTKVGAMRSLGPVGDPNKISAQEVADIAAYLATL